MTVVGGALVPGMPHLLAADPAPSWKELAEACREVGRRIEATQPDAIIVMSTQWFTVLGHQIQLDPNPRGRRSDENWYAYNFGHLEYDIRTDVDLAGRWAEELETVGEQARRTRYDGFPIDTGTVVAGALLDPRHRFPTAQVSCNLYADAAAMGRVAEAAVRAADALDRRVMVVGVSGMSSGLIQRWIEPHEDRFEDTAHDEWNRRVLDLLVDGRGDDALALREAYSTEAQVDSQARVLPFLDGAGLLARPAELLAYGPIWGTGAAVLSWQE